MQSNFCKPHRLNLCRIARQFPRIGNVALIALTLVQLMSMFGGGIAAGGELLTHGHGVQQEEESPTAEGIAFFETKIRPVLVEHCYSCHAVDASQVRGGLMLDSREGMRVGGNSGPAVVPGSLEDSLLWESITYAGLEMPPGAPLSDETIDDFRHWISIGAPDPRNGESAPVQSKVTSEVIRAGREFWSFQLPKRPALPAVHNTEWQRQDLDRFILAKLEEAELRPASDAEPRTLLRRLSFDLIGLPPSQKQLERFLETWSQNEDLALQQAVDELLDAPQFGERWGRHWLDVARFAESAGKEVNATYPNAWRYRDYVIDSFNDDKPYDRFLQEQIAGDLLPVDEDQQWAENLIATGFLTLGPKTLTERNTRQFQADLVDEQIDVLTRVVLGVSVACARCHDHKFDPIPQSDYYALAGILQSTKTYYGTLPTPQNRQPSDLIILPINDPNPADRRIGREQVAQLQQQIESAQAELNQLRLAFRQTRTRNDSRSNNSGDSIRATFRQIQLQSQRIALLQDRLRSVDEDGSPRSFAMGVQPAEQAQKARVLIRGELTQPAQEVEHGFVHVIDPDFGSVQTSTTSRLDLADWMTRPTNPLTARVMVNRIWQHLLGEGIVATPEDFGASGEAPSHPELLDYLALEFIDSGWSVKSMVRMIATSRTYRMAATHQPDYFHRDPDNRLLWRANPRRLDAEELRDAMLFISGNLDLDRPHASAVARQISPIAFDGMQNEAVPQRQFGVAGRNGAARNGRRSPRGVGMRPSGMDEESQSGANSPLVPGRFGQGRLRDALMSRRDESYSTSRSIYLAVLRDFVPESLELFDFAEPSMVIGKRDASTTPSQALYLMNDAFVIQQSEALAKRIATEAEGARAQMKLAFELVYGRPAHASELKTVERFIRDSQRSAGQERAGDLRNAAPLSLLCQALFASAEFRYLE